MFARSKVIVAVALVLVFVIGLAAYAQVQPKVRVPRTKVQAQPGMQQGAFQGLADLDPQIRKEHWYAFVNVQRFMRPPSRQELERLSVMLSLTEQQKQQIRALYQQFFTNVRPIYIERAAGVKEMLAVMQSPAPSKGAFESAVKKVEQADRALLMAEFDFWAAFKNILNAQQQTQVQSFLQQRVQMEAGPGGPPAGPRSQPRQ